MTDEPESTLDLTTSTTAQLWQHHAGLPWCDTCKKRAVFSEFFGNLHSSSQFPFGIPEHLDTSGHEVTMRDWYNVPWGGPPEESTSDGDG